MRSCIDHRQRPATGRCWLPVLPVAGGPPARWLVPAVLVLASFKLVAAEMDTGAPDSEMSRLEYYGDAQLRGDFVRDLPRPVDSDFERGTLRVRGGARWLAHDAVELGAALKVNLSTDGNGKTRANLDNERADDIALDELYLLAHLGERTELLAGQSAFPLRLSPMIWDTDLRPQGVSVRHGIPVGDFHSVELLGGLFLGNHLYGDDSVIRAAQATFNVNEGAPLAWRFALTWLDFSHLGKLAQEGLLRTNEPAAGGGYAHEYDLANVHASVTSRQFALPVRVRLDAVRNVAAGSDGSGGRGEFIVGDSGARRGVELGLAVQRVQREAVVAAFANDDWWFRSRMRGWMGWAGYGITDSLRVQVSGFDERLDVAPEHNWRILLDVQYTLN